MNAQARTYAEGENVKGLYHGQPYTGTVTAGRCHTLNHSFKHYVRLDRPITVYGARRENIIVAIWEPKESGNTIEAG
jgi:hypothetical protein